MTKTLEQVPPEESANKPHALQAAIAFGNWDEVQSLVSQGVDVNESGEFYGDPLSAAAYKCVENPSVVTLLLSHGASPNSSGGERHGPPLSAAAAAGNIAAMTLLLDAGADPNGRGGRYGTALQATIAQQWHHNAEEVVELLLSRGADLTLTGGEYVSALGAAMVFFPGDHRLPAMLLERTLALQPGKELLDDAVKRAPACGGLAAVRALVSAGADFDVLPYAAVSGDEETLHFLLDRGAKIDRVGGLYGTALQAIAHGGPLETMRLLMDRGASVDLTGGKYGTPLQAAAYVGEMDRVEELLGHGADVNLGFGEYGQPLQAAVQSGSADVVERLLRAGAEVNAKGGERGSALQAACEEGSLELVELMLRHGADVNLLGGGFIASPLTAAIRCGNVDIVRLLLDNGADPALTDAEKPTPLGEAEWSGMPELVQLVRDRLRNKPVVP